MSIAALIRAMAAAGAPSEAIAIAVEAIEAAHSQIEAQRASARDRKRRQRAKDAADGVTVTGQSRDSHGTERDNPSLSPAPSPSPHTPQLSPHPHAQPEHTPRARKGHRLPCDWQPEALTGGLADSIENWPPGAIERELARFRDWAASATGQTALKSDWQATWRNWLRRAEDDGKYRDKRKPASNDEIQNPYVRAALARQGAGASPEWG